MNQPDATTDFDPSDDRRECQPAMAALQRLLDGEPLGDVAQVEMHRSTCVDCREEWALAHQLLRPIPAIVVPSGLVEASLSAVLADRRSSRRRRWMGAAMALAASVAIAVVVVRPPVDRQQVALVSIDPKPAPVVAAKKPNTDPIADARQALASLSRSLPSTIETPRLNLDMTDPVDPLEPLADARNGAERSIQPFADSARRAVNLFLSPTSRPIKPAPQ